MPMPVIGSKLIVARNARKMKVLFYDHRLIINELRYMEQYLTLKEAATLLGCAPDTLRKWHRNGKIKAKRLGQRNDRRFSKQALLRLLKTAD